MSRACELTGEAPQLAALIAQLQFQLCDHHGQLPHPQQHWGHNRVGWRLALVFLWHSSAFKLFRVLTKYLWKHDYVLMKCHKGNFVSKFKNEFSKFKNGFFNSIWEDTLVFSVPKYLSFSNKADAAGEEQNLLWAVFPFCLILWAIVLLLKICPLVFLSVQVYWWGEGSPLQSRCPWCPWWEKAALLQAVLQAGWKWQVVSTWGGLVRTRHCGPEERARARCLRHCCRDSLFPQPPALGEITSLHLSALGFHAHTNTASSLASSLILFFSYSSAFTHFL